MSIIYTIKLKHSALLTRVSDTIYPVIAIGILVYLLFDPNRTADWAYLLLAVGFWGLRKDQKKTAWKRFLPLGIPLLLFPLLLWHYFPPFWNQVVYWQLGLKPHLFNWDTLFQSIPGNDGRLFRVIQTPWLTAYFQWIYANGFTLPVLIPVLRSFFAKDWIKMFHYELSAHVLQFLLIFPFYLTIKVNEVWWVLGDPDGMHRNLTASDAAVVVMNCFPSMHTSVAFAMLLLAWREKDRLFRIIWSVFGFSVIYSTLYLEIHWVIDVLGGLVLGYVGVKLGDWVIHQIESKTGKMNAKEREPQSEISQVTG